MDAITPPPDLVIVGLLAFLGTLGVAAGAVLGVARRRGWISSWRHPFAGPTWPR